MPKHKKPTLVLIDSHAIIHRAYHALPDLTDKDGNPAGALYGLSSMLIKLISELKPDYIAAAYDLAGPTHRHEVYQDYKGTRAKTEDSLIDQIDRSRDIFEAFHIPVYEATGFEADDVIGTFATNLKKDFDVIIASGDMDTLQLVSKKDVQVFTLRKGINDTVTYDEDAVYERFGFKPTFIADYKGLAGDPSDNIIGIPGIGAKTATKLIQTYGSIEHMYAKGLTTLEKFKKDTGFTERIFNLLKDNQEEAEFSKVLATIRIDAPVSFDTERSHWNGNFSSERATELFTRLGFRSLVPRIQSLGGMSEKDAPVPSTDESEEMVTLDEEEELLFKEAAVALWLSQSETTNPSLEDVLNETGAKNIRDAHTKLMGGLKEQKLTEVFEKIEKPLIPVIDTLNQNGILIDEAYLKELSKEYKKDLDALAKSIYTQSGVEFNLNSPKQLGEVLFEKMAITPVRKKKTSTGQISTKESELVKLKDEYPIINDILSYRELQKLLSTYIDAIPPLLGEDKRLHTTFVQTGTTTGRLSSRDPNLQNIPIKSELGRRIRRAFIADKGNVLVSFDYSQIELRLAAFLSGDAKLKEIFIHGEDVHTAVAAEVFNVPPERVEYEMRRRAKVINFGILYGMGVNALREALGTDRAEAQEYLNTYFERFSGLASYLSKTKATAARVGYTKTYFGRRRYFPGIQSRLPHIRASAERMAINAPIQGTQSDIIKIAMVRIHDLIQKEFASDAKMVLQIHDELMFEVAQDVQEVFSKKTKELMEQVLTQKELDGVPLIVSGAVGHNWEEMKAL